MGASPPPLFPVPQPSLTPTTVRDVSTSGERYHDYGSLSPGQLASFRGEATRLRRGYRLSPCSPSPSLASSRAERGAALRSTLLEWRSEVAVFRPPVEIDVVGQLGCFQGV